MICLDSSVIVDFLRNNEKAIDFITNLRSEDVATTVINVYELESGIWAMKNENYAMRLDNLNKFLSKIKLLQLDTYSVNQSAKIFGELSRGGKIIEDLDILIAGVCLVNNCDTIITENIKHFSRIKGLKVETY